MRNTVSLVAAICSALAAATLWAYRRVTRRLDDGWMVDADDSLDDVRDGISDGDQR